MARTAAPRRGGRSEKSARPAACHLRLASDVSRFILIIQSPEYIIIIVKIVSTRVKAL